MTSEESTSGPRTELTESRQAIEEIDRRIIALLAERLVLGERAGELKRAAGLPILDAPREAEVIRRAVSTARELHLPTEPVREIFWRIVGMSRRLQEGDESR